MNIPFRDLSHNDLKICLFAGTSSMIVDHGRSSDGRSSWTKFMDEVHGWIMDEVLKYLCCNTSPLRR
ncbi:hypothetical protein TNCT_249421 [Trichonephila clavata]|uniref:Uncharacterized protein n=1 Tax=Trichonephila clavata TaxID=2740835 RepID=A0A8X6HH71_TRICU|nr:hypothetical protein TNCT_249421 [Trichonephila clavata]